MRYSGRLTFLAVLFILGSLFLEACGENATSNAAPQAQVVATTAPSSTTAPATQNVQATAAANQTATAAANQTATAAAMQTALAQPTSTPKPTNTAVPTATPRPTSTPAPTATPKPTPDTAATAAAQTSATAAAQAKATANAQATIAALPKPIDIVGNGDKVTQKVTLTKGTSRATLNYTGQSNFIIKMLDENGKDIDLVVNEIGPYSGTTFIPVPKTGNYVFNIQAEGNWALKLHGIELLLQEAPVSFPLKGKGDTAVIVSIPKTSLTTFKMSHNGDSNFIVKVIDVSDGETQVLLANKIGSYQGEVAKKADAGTYPIEVIADGEWTIEIIQ